MRCYAALHLKCRSRNNFLHIIRYLYRRVVVINHSVIRCSLLVVYRVIVVKLICLYLLFTCILNSALLAVNGYSETPDIKAAITSA